MEFLTTIQSGTQSYQEVFHTFGEAVHHAIDQAFAHKHAHCYVGSAVDPDTDLFSVTSDSVDELDDWEIAQVIAQHETPIENL